jgi:hypothetical protein
VTSIVAGNCGTSALDVGEALTRIRQTGAAVNFATLVGHNTVREAVMGTADRIPPIPELDRMKSLVWRAMVDGAVGFSTGLQYVPGTYARVPEILGLRDCRQWRRPARSHMERGHRARGRNRGDHPGGARRACGSDLSPEGGQPKALGRQHEGAR